MRNLTFVLGGTILVAGSALAKSPDPAGPTVKGPLGKDAVRKVVQLHIEEVRLCYEPELERNAKLAGRIVVSFTINAEGRVSEAKLDKERSSLGNAVVENCAVKAVSGWEFPKHKGNTVVSYPFVLRPADPEGEKKGAPAR